MKRQNTTNITSHLRLFTALVIASLLFVGCADRAPQEVERLNDRAYAFHYRNLDSTYHYASRALELSADYSSQRAEAVNNLAFVGIARMNYADARLMLDSLIDCSDDAIELLIADIQQMRICQRCSQNKQFYDYRDRAEQCLRRIHEDADRLTARQKARMRYAESEYHIVVSTYYYYLGLERQAADALDSISPHAQSLQTDTAQYLAFLYNYGAGGTVSNGSQEQIYRQEFDLLTRCYQIAQQQDYPFWRANALQAISEHLLIPGIWDNLTDANRAAVTFINANNVPDSLLAGELAMQALDIFAAYGDVYQTASAYRTLAQCYQHIEDYATASALLHEALDADTLISQAPDLVASICEQLSVVNAALDDKPESDRYRNMYLDLIGHTQQDKAQEAQHESLVKDDRQHSVFVVVLVAVLLSLLLYAAYLFVRQRRNNYPTRLMHDLSLPMKEWQHRQKQSLQEAQEHNLLQQEERQSQEILLQNNQHKYMQQRAKTAIVNSITPLIERIIVEYQRAQNTPVTEQQSQYIVELTRKIEDYNATLTQWIQMQQGELNLRIESFPLQPLFDIMAQNRTSFQLKGIHLLINPTTAVVKADSTLTLFMLNTIADNARRFTQEGGEIRINADETERYVEVSIEDNGCGMTSEQCEDLFKLNPTPTLTTITHHPTPNTQQPHYGFGLLNCRGIIEKYRKLSPLFNVCHISCESTVGKGSRFFFRLPKGIIRTIGCLLMLLLPVHLPARTHTANPNTPSEWADSAYFANINGHYSDAIRCADKARRLINADYIRLHPGSGDTLLHIGSLALTPPEVDWLHNNTDAPYDILLDIRNESAVAALAMHQWNLYKYNNRVYTLLYKELSADNNINKDIHSLQRSIRNKNTAIIVLATLILLAIAALLSRYFMPRKRLKKYAGRFENMNALLASDASDEDKLGYIARIDTSAYPVEMQKLASQMAQMLKKNITAKAAVAEAIEQENDQLKRLQYENQRLHVTNSVLDNCLSTLKHETMYFPARIRQMQENGTHTTADILELTQYYATLHSLMATQAQQQTDNTPTPTPRLLYTMLTQTLESINAHPIYIRKENCDNPQYAELSVGIHIPENVDAPAQHLFDIDQHGNHDFLLCRQIVRDIGEMTNHRGCGIKARQAEHNTATIIITLPKKLVDTTT